MTGKYIVAGNLFTIDVEGEVPAWEAIRERFSPFAADSGDEAVLDVSVRSGELPSYDGADTIYEPEYNGIGIVGARAMRLPDGEIAMEFRIIDGDSPRVMMTMTGDFSSAKIVIAPGDVANDMYILTHALMIAFMLSTVKTGTLMIHSSAVTYRGRAYLFQGKSGTGKSTHAGMWLKHIAGAEQLNDDNPIIRFGADGAALAYGSPWSGKTACYRNVSAPIGGFVRIVRAPENELRRLSPLKGYASLTSSIYFLPFLGEELRGIRHKTLERLVMTTPCYEMHCRPNGDAARVCAAGLSKK